MATITVPAAVGIDVNADGEGTNALASVARLECC